MGRPPIGKKAMTDAERQRKHRAKAIYAAQAEWQAAIKGAWLADHPGKNVDDYERAGSCGDTEKGGRDYHKWFDGWMARAGGDIHRRCFHDKPLVTKQTKHDDVSNTRGRKLEQEIATLKALLLEAEADMAAMALRGAQRHDDNLTQQVRDLNAENKKLREIIGPRSADERERFNAYKRMVDRDYKRRIRHYDTVIRKNYFVMDERTYALILAGLHPDQGEAAKYRDKARELFEPYKKFVLKKKDALKLDFD